MADLIEVEKGFPPWEPAHNATLNVALNYYDVPLTGVTVQHDVHYLFHCLMGGGRAASVWVFACLTPGEDEEFVGLEGRELLSAVERFIVRRDSIAAVADEVRGIEWHDHIHPHSDVESYIETVRGRLADVLHDLSEVVSSTED